MNSIHRINQIISNILSSQILLLFLLFNSLSRLSLVFLAAYEEQIDPHILELLQVFGFGLINDLVAAIYLMLPLVFIGLIISDKFRQNMFIRSVAYSAHFIIIIALCFLVVAEYTFWLEFNTRFNFIAVDYLVYTHEVLGNIQESYPVFLIMTIVSFVSMFVYYKAHPHIKEKLSNYKTSFKRFLGLFLAAIMVFFLYNPKITDISDDNYLSEISKNGLYNLFSAFRHNSIDYNSFYQANDQQKSLNELATYISQDKPINPKFLERYIQANGPAKNYNIFVITIESLSSEFLTTKYQNKPLTPVLNDLIKQSVYFNNFYATGTRTVRGLEAITLSIPPLPGQSILRREHNENLFSIATILNKENYELKFIYGGAGYFDNMNYFFQKNGFKIFDRKTFPDKEIDFENIWGVSDEDLYKQAIKQADLSYDKKQKFFSLVMTTSNHRPYTYREGAIDIPSKFGRYGGVKYTDYALGEFLKAAKNKPWFDKTIFVITADHCAGSAGKVALPPSKYHIPLFIYAPKILKPEVITKLSSQIDIAPTIMGILNISYNSRFFGNDIFTKNYQNAFISTFQKLGYVEEGKLVVLIPGKLVQTYNILDNHELVEIDNEPELTNRAIAYYQSSYYLYQNGLLKQNASNAK